MKYFYDTEFIEDGRTIDLISIGIVADDGRDYYAVNSDMPTDRIVTNTWLMFNVVTSLPVSSSTLTSIERRRKHGESLFPRPEMNLHLDSRSTLLKPHWVIANEVREFLIAADGPELWADYGAYDHVVLSQLWGTMMDRPSGIPMYTNDIQQAAARVGIHEGGLPQQASGQHNALEDARHCKVRWKAIDREECGL